MRKTLAEAVAEVESVAGDIARTLIRDASGYDRVLQLFFTRAVRAFRAVRLLAEKGLGIDALILVRALYEQVLNLLYIATDPDRLAEQYLEYAHYRNWVYLRFLRRHYPEAVARMDPAAVQEMRRQFLRVRKRYPDGRSWHGRVIGDLARLLRLDGTHETLYKITCDVAHGNVPGFYSLLTQAEDRLWVQDGPGGDDGYSEEAVELAVQCVLPILGEVSRHFGLGMEDRMDGIRARLHGAPRRPATFA